MHTYALSHTMMGRLPANEQGPYARCAFVLVVETSGGACHHAQQLSRVAGVLCRRLECCLLLFLGTLSALPLPPGTVQSGVDRKRCVMLNVLLKAEEQALASLWRLLLGTASAAAAGMDTLSLLAEVACRGLRVGGCSLSLLRTPCPISSLPGMSSSMHWRGVREPLVCRAYVRPAAAVPTLMTGMPHCTC